MRNLFSNKYKNAKKAISFEPAGFLKTTPFFSLSNFLTVLSLGWTTKLAWPKDHECSLHLQERSVGPTDDLGAPLAVAGDHLLPAIGRARGPSSKPSRGEGRGGRGCSVRLLLASPREWKKRVLS